MVLKNRGETTLLSLSLSLSLSLHSSGRIDLSGRIFKNNFKFIYKKLKNLSLKLKIINIITNFQKVATLILGITKVWRLNLHK